MNQKLKPSNYSLLLLWMIQCVIVLLCCFLNPNHFTTIDSQYYLDSAQNILDGNSYSRLQNGVYTWNSTFPPGYSILIGVIAFLTSLPVLWASKVLNLLVSGIWLWQLRKWYSSERALFTGSVLLFGPLLKLWCHTWSEPLFLVLLFNWVRAFFYNRRKFTIVLSLGVALISVRYAGVFIIPLSAGMSVLWFRKDQKRAYEALAFSLSWSVFFGSWMLVNYFLSGEFYGSERFGQTDKISEVIFLFGKGLANEIFIFGDTDWQRFDEFFSLGILVQFFLLFRLHKALSKRPKFDYFLLTACSYLLFLVVMRTISPFDQPRYRLLSPFSFLIGWCLLSNSYEELTNTRSQKIYLVLVLFSWLHLLPQTDTSKKIQQAVKQLMAISPNTP